MKAVLSLAIAIFFISCGHSTLVSHLDGSDSIIVRFTKPGDGSFIKQVTSTQHYGIQDFLIFAGSEKIEQPNCGYDGKVMFYKKGNQAGDISFNYTVDGCRHFLIYGDGKQTATKMSNEAIDFLKELANSNK